jgi:uncharacterized protein
MTESPENNEHQVFDATPYLRLVIDKEGRWFQNGAEIIHREIYLMFNKLLEKTSQGTYQVKMGKEICRVEVEDAPFVVQRVVEADSTRIMIELNDGTEEVFSPEEFWIGGENIPYSRIKDGEFHARYSRPAYYQLAKHIVTDQSEKDFYFLLDGNKIPVRTTPVTD